MKKTWIKLKRGLVEPKHRDKLGIRIWLYLYILDQADWGQGAVINWIDKNAADELGMPISTVRKQRRQLEEDKYISCLQKKDHQQIVIKNWTNPREYSGEVYNKSIQNSTPLKNEGDHKVITTMDTPSSNSHITSHKTKEDRDTEKDRKTRITEGMAKGYKAHRAGKNKNQHYPPDVIKTITAFEKHFKIKPPHAKDSGYSLWVKSAREINRLSSDYKIASAAAIRNYFLAWDREGRGYSINSPQSILKSLRGYLGERESGEEFIGSNGEVRKF